MSTASAGCISNAATTTRRSSTSSAPSRWPVTTRPSPSISATPTSRRGGPATRCAFTATRSAAPRSRGRPSACAARSTTCSGRGRGEEPPEHAAPGHRGARHRDAVAGCAPRLAPRPAGAADRGPAEREQILASLVQRRSAVRGCARWRGSASPRPQESRKAKQLVDRRTPRPPALRDLLAVRRRLRPHRRRRVPRRLGARRVDRLPRQRLAGEPAALRAGRPARADRRRPPARHAAAAGRSRQCGLGR